MFTPAHVDLIAQRWTPFVDVTAFEGYDFSAATFAMHVRLYRDAPGSPLIALSNAVSSAQGISVTTEVIEGITYSNVQIRINETTLEPLLLNPSKDVELVYDLHITGGGLGKTRWLQGKFIIEAGATQNG
jgi:hypothetical protein